MTKIVVDTSVLIKDPKFIADNIDINQLIIASTTLNELDLQKESESPKRSYKGRSGLRIVEKYEEKFTFEISDKVEGLSDNFDTNNNDNKILSVAKRNNAKIATYDRGMKVKALGCGISVVDLKESMDDVNPLGYRIFEWDCTDLEIASKLNDLAEDDTRNIFDLEINEFGILKDLSKPIFTDEEVSDDYEIQGIFQWTGQRIIPLKYKNIDNRFTGKVRPRNIQQKMLFSLLQNNNIKIVTTSGQYGSGKDFAMLSNALEMVEKHKFKKIVWFRNPTEVRGVSQVGFLPGSYLEKVADYTAVIDDIVGDAFGTEMLIKDNKLEIGNLGAVRGRTFKDSIVILTEAQNCSPEVVQLLLSRIGEGSVLWTNGDHRQLDTVNHSISSIDETIRVLHGRPEFGWVQLDKVERSEIADLARLFDEK